MKLFWIIALSAGAVIAILFLTLVLAACFGRRELSRTSADMDDDTIQIFAQAESLEYYIRCALMAGTLGRVQIVVNIHREDAHRDEMIDLTCRLGREHKNLTYRLI